MAGPPANLNVGNFKRMEHPQKAKHAIPDTEYRLISHQEVTHYPRGDSTNTDDVLLNDSETMDVVTVDTVVDGTTTTGKMLADDLDILLDKQVRHGWVVAASGPNP